MTQYSQALSSYSCPKAEVAGSKTGSFMDLCLCPKDAKKKKSTLELLNPHSDEMIRCKMEGKDRFGDAGLDIVDKARAAFTREAGEVKMAVRSHYTPELETRQVDFRQPYFVCNLTTPVLKPAGILCLISPDLFQL